MYVNDSKLQPTNCFLKPSWHQCGNFRNTVQYSPHILYLRISLMTSFSFPRSFSGEHEGQFGPCQWWSPCWANAAPRQCWQPSPVRPCPVQLISHCSLAQWGHINRSSPEERSRFPFSPRIVWSDRCLFRCKSASKSVTSCACMEGGS